MFIRFEFHINCSAPLQCVGPQPRLLLSQQDVPLGNCIGCWDEDSLGPLDLSVSLVTTANFRLEIIFCLLFLKITCSKSRSLLVLLAQVCVRCL